MTPKIVFGPISGNRNGDNSYINIPVRVHGEYFSSQEGFDALASAKVALEAAKLDARGILEPGTVIEQLDENTLNVRIPCIGYEGIMSATSDAMDLIPELTGASYTDVVVRAL